MGATTYSGTLTPAGSTYLLGGGGGADRQLEPRWQPQRRDSGPGA